MGTLQIGVTENEALKFPDACIFHNYSCYLIKKNIFMLSDKITCVKESSIHDFILYIFEIFPKFCFRYIKTSFVELTSVSLTRNYFTHFITKMFLLLVKTEHLELLNAGSFSKLLNSLFFCVLFLFTVVCIENRHLSVNMSRQYIYN